MKYFWHFYIALLLSLSIGRLVERILIESGGFASRYLPVIAVLILSVGIYGSIKNKPILSRWFWLIVFAISILASALAIAFSAYLALFVGAGAMLGVTLLLLTTVLLIPAQLKLRDYISKTNKYWSTKTD